MTDTAPSSLPVCDSLDEVARLVRETVPLYVRYSEGPEHDRREASVDLESGLELPGLSVNPLTPELWWTRPLEDWLARQLCQYQHLARKNPRRMAWLLTGRETGRGPDCEPLIAAVVPVATVSGRALEEAAERYEQCFDVGRGPED